MGLWEYGVLYTTQIKRKGTVKDRGESQLFRSHSRKPGDAACRLPMAIACLSFELELN